MSDGRDEAAAYTFKRVTPDEWQLWHEGQQKATVTGEQAHQAMLGRIHPADLITEFLEETQ